MRIYQVNIEHEKWGRNYDSRRVAARTCEEAIRKAKRELTPSARVESVALLAATD